MPTIRVSIKKSANYNTYEVAYEEDSKLHVGEPEWEERCEEIRSTLRKQVNDEISKNSPMPN